MIEEVTYRCGQCLDEPCGWISLACTGTTCERGKSHAAHWFVVRCPCWLVRNEDDIVRNAQAALTKGKAPGATYGTLTDLRAGRYLWVHAVTVQVEQARARAERAEQAAQAEREERAS